MQGTSFSKCLLFIAIFVFISQFSCAAEPIRLSILSYNIHHAEGVDHQLNIERIARVIKSAKPDIVALQEVDRNVKRSLSIDQPAALAKLCKMNVVFGANIPLQGGHYGNTVLTRFPIVTQQNQKLPNVDKGEQRGVITVEIDVNKSRHSIILFATHLDHRRDDHERVASAKMINETAKTFEHHPMLLAGDMNDVIGSRTLTEFESLWTRTNTKSMPTIPVAEPKRQIDFILCRPARRWKVVDVKVLGEATASDHRGILAILELSPH